MNCMKKNFSRIRHLCCFSGISVFHSSEYEDSCLLCCCDCPDDRGSKHIWIVRKLMPDYMAQQPRKQPSSYSLPWEPLMSLGKLVGEGYSSLDSEIQNTYIKKAKWLCIVSFLLQWRDWGMALRFLHFHHHIQLFTVWWRHQAPLKRQWTSTGPHWTTTQTITVFMLL
jgi:hypothetical protein